MLVRRFVLAAVLSVLAIPAVARGDDRCASAILRHGTDLFVGTKDIEARCERRQLFVSSAVGCPSARDSRRIGELIGLRNAGIVGACRGQSFLTNACVNSAGVEAVDLVSAIFRGSPRPDPDRVRRNCRRVIGREGARLADVKARQLDLCNNAVLRGAAGFGPAGPTCDGPNGTQAAIATAEARLEKKIARACGGPDLVAGTGDDLDLHGVVGAGATCPGSPYCESPVETLPDIIACVSCIAHAEVAQMSRVLATLPLSAATACDIAVGLAAMDLADDYLRDLSACEERILAGDTAAPCPDAETSEDLQASLDAFDGLIAAGCVAPAAPPSAFVTATADELIQLVYPTHAEETDAGIKRCKSEIGAAAGATSSFTRRKLSALRTCQLQHACDSTSGPCPDSETAQQIASGASFMANRIHSRCDTYSPAALGFPPTCPAVGSCDGLPTTTITELIACVTCVAGSVVDDVVATGF